jgi:putative transcriptional regulator
MSFTLCASMHATRASASSSSAPARSFRARAARAERNAAHVSTSSKASSRASCPSLRAPRPAARRRAAIALRAAKDDAPKNEDDTKKEPEPEPSAASSSEDAEKLPTPEDDVAPALEGDWRDFRARLVSMESGAGSSTDEEEKVEEASGPNLELLREQNPALAAEKPWAHVIGAPERGCLLVARGDNFTQGQQYFHQAVILMLEHNEKGSMGVILNRPTQYSMGYVSGDESGPFAQNALYFGGDVGDGTVSFLHGSSSVTGSVEVSAGVFLGGYESACELVKTGEVEANDCKFFARYCGWGPGQLQSECERGVWYPVACSKQIALKQVIQLPKPLWREVSELVGGDVGYESRKAYGEATKEDAEKYGDGDE